jgi:hypothetical protein
VPPDIASPSPSSIYRKIALLSGPNRVIDVMTAKSAEQRRFKMIFTIDNENNIVAHGTEEAAGATATPFESFSSQQELAELAQAWPAERLVAIWNCLAGVTPVESFKSAKSAASRIWQRIQGLGAPETPKADKPEPKTGRKAKGGAQAAKGAPAKGKATEKATSAKTAAKGAKGAKPAKAEAAARQGSKTEKVLNLLKRPGGVTAKELMKVTGWQPHSVRGFLSGTVGKKMGLAVISTKSENGGRTYSVEA